MTDLEIKLMAALDEIGRLAMSCQMDMQGRLADDEHKRAFNVLCSIASRAAVALKDTAEIIAHARMSGAATATF